MIYFFPCGGERVMWDLLFSIALLVGCQTAAATWVRGGKPSLLSIGLSAGMGLLVGITAFFTKNQIWLAFLAGHITYTVSESVCRRTADALATVALCLLADLLLIPFSSCTEEMKSYSFYGLIVLLSLIFAGLYQIGGGSEQWLNTVKEISKTAYVILCCVPIPGAAVQLIILLLSGQRTQSLATIGIYILLICIAAAALLIQRLCAEHFILTKTSRDMQAWQQGARDYMNTIRSQRHDFNIHLHAIDGMIGNQKYEQCRRYINKMVEDAGAVNDIMPVYDATIGSMLYNMRRQAQLIGSDIYYDIKYNMKDVVCNAFECNKIIGNLIQNALDALDCEEAIQQGIRVNIFRRSGNAVITVSNYFHGDEQAVLRAFDMNWSGKTGHEGIGLGMIERTLKKYGGKIMAEWQDQNVTFIVHIPVKYLLEEDDQ